MYGNMASYSPLMQQQQQQAAAQQARLSQSRLQQQQQHHAAQAVSQQSTAHGQQTGHMGYGQDMFSGFGVNGGSSSQFP